MNDSMGGAFTFHVKKHEDRKALHLNLATPNFR